MLFFLLEVNKVGVIILNSKLCIPQRPFRGKRPNKEILHHKPPCIYASAIAPQFLSILLQIAFLLFCRLLLTTALKLLRLRRDCNSIALPQSSTIHTVKARGSVISLAGGFLS